MGESEGIKNIFPQTGVQLCVVHQIRNSFRYVTSEDTKPFLKDLKKVYQAKSKEPADLNLDELEKLRGEKYPVVILFLRNNWGRIGQRLSILTKYKVSFI